MLLERRLDDFLSELASNSPAPGGGSVAALSGALSCALISMVCNLTIGKPKYSEVEGRIKVLLEKSEEMRKLFQELIEKDVEAFNDVIAAYKMPKITAEEKALREKAIQHALQKATYVPLRTMEHSVEALKLANEIARIGLKSSVSDAGVAAQMAQSAIEGARLNVSINLAGIENKEFVEKITNQTEKIMEEANGLLEQTIDTVEDRIYGEE